MRLPFNGSYPMTRGFATALIKNDKGIPHQGEDYATPKQTRLYAATPGKVVYSMSSNDGSGKAVVIRNGNLQTKYFHMDSLGVKFGDQLKEGDYIGTSGNTGNTTGPHLHFQVEELINNNWVPVNPRKYLGEKDMAEKIDLNIARQLAHGILGRNGITGANALAGDADEDLKANHVGKELTLKYIDGLYNSQEAKNWRDKQVPELLERLKQKNNNNTELLDALEIVGKYIK